MLSVVSVSGVQCTEFIGIFYIVIRLTVNHAVSLLFLNCYQNNGIGNFYFIPLRLTRVLIS